MYIKSCLCKLLAQHDKTFQRQPLLPGCTFEQVKGC